MKWVVIKYATQWASVSKGKRGKLLFARRDAPVNKAATVHDEIHGAFTFSAWE